jgi:hydrogen peroxide-dependent heme synthase
MANAVPRFHVSSMDHALPPETAEGWYALHQVFTLDRVQLRAMSTVERQQLLEDSRRMLTELTATRDQGGWSAIVDLVGSTADVMFVHFRPTLDELGVAQREMRRSPLEGVMRPAYSFLSVTEAGFYHLTAQLARDVTTRGGKIGDAEHRAAIQAKREAELASDHVKRRLYPELPEGMPYVCFYPMDKKREAGQNWYTLPVDERSRLMHEHGMTGRKFSGKILQIITGAMGLADWEWGVTLFANDPLEFKKIVTEMRFDEASAKYGDFGQFWVGKLAAVDEFLSSI